MKKTKLLVTLFLFIVQQKSFSQCTASISNIAHGDCEGTDIEMIATGGSTGCTYQWTGPNGFTCTASNAMIYSAPVTFSGTYKVVISNTDGCSASATMDIVKHPVPLVYTGGSPGGCLGSTTYIYAQDYAGSFGPYEYRWDHGETTQTLAITHGGGSYPAPACKITNTYGCWAYNYTTFMIYTVATPDAPVIEPLDATSFCKGGSARLTTAGSPDYTYSWLKNGVDVSGAFSNELLASKAGDYSLKVSNSMGCSSVSNTIHITVHNYPEAVATLQGTSNICGSDSSLLVANAGNNFTYQWKNYKNQIAGATASSFYVKTKGTYRVLVGNQFGCVKLSNAVTISSNCREEKDEQIALEKPIHVYPNPSNNVFNLELINSNNTVNESAEIIITDVTGRVIEKRNLTNNETTIQFGESLTAGIYVAQVMRGEEVQTQRIIKTE